MEKKSYFYIITAATLWGLIGLFFNHLSSLGFEPMEIVALRVFSAAIVLLIYILFKDKSLLEFKIKDIGYFISTGVFSLFFFNLCYFTSIKLTSLSIAAILLYTAPIFVMIMSVILFNEKITFTKIISIIFTFIGCVFISSMTGDESISFIEIAIGLGAGFGYALYSIFGKLALRKYNTFTITLYTFIFASLVSIPFSGITKKVSLIFSYDSITSIFGIGIICCMLPYILYTKGLSNVNGSTASIFATIEPVVASLVGITIYNESVTINKIIGICMILMSVVLVNLNDKISVFKIDTFFKLLYHKNVK